MEKSVQHTLNAVLIILGLYYALAGLIRAQGFLMPIVAAGLLATLLLPISGKLESWGFNKTLAAFISVILLLSLATAFVFYLVEQIQIFLDELPKMIDNLQAAIESLKQYISEKTGITPWEQEKRLESIIKKRTKTIGNSAISILTNIPGFLQTTLLIIVYTFFFIIYRDKFTGFLLRLVSEEKRTQAKEIIHDAGKVAQKYLLGRLVLIVILAVTYYIGFSIIDIKYAVFLSGLMAVLSLIPYLGNLIGLVFALAVVLLTGLGASGFFGVLIIFAVAQFVESYILVPFVVGQQVELNAIMTIVAIVLGGAVWGVAGVIIAIPVVGILKVVCDRIPQLQAFGYLLGEDGISGYEKLKALKSKIKGLR